MFLILLLVIAFSHYGNIRLGPDDARPEFSFTSWLAMLFAAARSSVAIASITAMLAMKLQAFLDRPFDRQRDAQDVVWLARSLDPDVIGDDLVACRSARGDLVDEILARLEQHFADPWSRGISAYFEQAFRGRTSFDEDARREGGAAAIGALLAAYRRLA